MEIISGRMQTALKVVVYGPEGIGKSTFASQAPFPLFCDVEDSTMHMDVRRLPKPTSAQMIVDEARYVLNHPELCRTFVLDTADWAERLCREKVCAEKSIKGIEDVGYGKGYTYVFEEFGKVLDALTDLVQRGIHVIVNAHAIMRKFEQPDEMNAYDRWELKLNNSPKCSIANMLKEWADIVLFANYETFAVKQSKESKAKAQGGQRVMYTAHHPCWDAKNRFGLPDKLPFEFTHIAYLFSLPEQKTAGADAAAASGRPTGAMNDSRSFAALRMTQGTGAMNDSRSFADAQDDTEKQGAVQTEADNTALSFGKGDYRKDIASVVPGELPEITEPDPDLPFAGPTEQDGIPKALLDLMQINGISEQQIVDAVTKRGNYVSVNRIREYAPDFIEGVLIGAWEQVFDFIKTNNL